MANKYSMLNLIESSLSAERCQRNWNESSIVKDQDIEDIVQICTNMPTKGNKETYQLIVSKNLDYNKQIFKYCYNSEDENHLENVNKNIFPNPQVASQVLFIWISNTSINDNTPADVFMDDVNLSVGISSGSAALSANSYGYKTGFCKCFDSEKLNTFLRKTFDISKKDRVNLLLGIGVPVDDLPHNSSITEFAQKDHDSYDKNIKIHYKN
jgi:nitroreductase